MDAYLLGLRLQNRRVVIVGGGAVATRRIPALLHAGADIVLVSPSATTSLEDLAAAGRIRWERRRYADGDLAGAWLACACTDDAAVNAAISAAAEQQHVWSVRADNAEASAAWTPASGRADDIPAEVRADDIPAEVRAGGRTGDVRASDAQGAGTQRRSVQVGVLSGDPRRSAAIRDAILTGLRTGQLSARHVRGHRGGVAIIGGGPGDPGLITVRGRQLLAEADVVLTDRLAPTSLLDELPADVEIIDVSKIPYGRAMPQDQINATLIERARAGRFVARLKGGDPFVFGRGAEEVLACLRAGVPVTVVPGVTSAVGVPTSAWLPVTHRGVAQEFHVVSVHVPPGDDRSTVDWALLGGSRGTLVLLMSVQRIGAVAAELLRHGRNPDTPVSVIADGTMPTQRTISSSLEQVEGMVTREGIRPPAIVVVGDVVDIAAEITELMRNVTAW
ncbi:MAG TPA: uroporphyrinogen-III C-methyltransferase [Streptosporangiaceae bacterium]|nr:uroporphyrinogen-III C-methyltransferase [Streptosporangiaceae bacterium]